MKWLLALLANEVEVREATSNRDRVGLRHFLTALVETGDAHVTAALKSRSLATPDADERRPPERDTDATAA